MRTGEKKSKSILTDSTSFRSTLLPWLAVTLNDDEFAPAVLCYFYLCPEM